MCVALYHFSVLHLTVPHFTQVRFGHNAAESAGKEILEEAKVHGSDDDDDVKESSDSNKEEAADNDEEENKVRMTSSWLADDHFDWAN